MSSLTAIRRVAAAGGVAGLIALCLAGPSAARPDPGTGDLPRCTSGCYHGGTDPSGGPTADTNTVEYIQLGAGVLAGIALTGFGVAVTSRRGHGQVAHPA
ncbi:MAG TPA: hypothetical protein VGN19_12400 [Pedococcus sp.]|jgi:hypothetical protein|nr:hypothetical protein [Pedococcus sp.]